MHYLNVDSRKVGKVHPCWKTVVTVKVRIAAITKVRLLTGTYYLQKNRVKFKNGAATDTCLFYC